MLEATRWLAVLLALLWSGWLDGVLPRLGLRREPLAVAAALILLAHWLPWPSRLAQVDAACAGEVGVVLLALGNLPRVLWSRALAATLAVAATTWALVIWVQTAPAGFLSPDRLLGLAIGVVGYTVGRAPRSTLVGSLAGSWLGQTLAEAVLARQGTPVVAALHPVLPALLGVSFAVGVAMICHERTFENVREAP